MKHTFSKLARGVKLQTGHIYTAIVSALANLTSDAGATAGVVVDQMAQPSGPFTIHLSVPTFDGWRKAFSIPFTLPAYQSDAIWSLGFPGSETPVFRVESVGFSFDNGDELAGVGGEATVNNNMLIFGALANYKLEVSLLETLQFGQGAITTGTFNQARYATVWSSTIPTTAWEAGLNPVTFSEISADLSPLKTYILKVVAPDLDGTPECRFPNLNIWLNLSTPLVRRDRHVPASGEYVQNLPSVHDGITQVTAVTTTEPAAGSKVTAELSTDDGDASDGVQTALGRVDKLFRDKLRGNYNIHSELPADENLTDNAAYKIIAVPMWGNLRSDITPSLVEDRMPYAGAFPCSAMMTDRRIIPISKNFTVHHVVACANYGNDDKYPAVATFSHNVGVGIGSGLRSDLHTYQEVAFKSWQPYAPSLSLLSYGIDKLGVILDDTLVDNWEMVGIPLVEISGESSANYGQQGKPFFIGQSRYNKVAPSGTNVRTNVGEQPAAAPPGGAPNTAGQESFIEVRWGIQDTAGATGLPVGTVIAPRYGNWVYIIGKTTTVTSNQE